MLGRCPSLGLRGEAAQLKVHHLLLQALQLLLLLREVNLRAACSASKTREAHDTAERAARAPGPRAFAQPVAQPVSSAAVSVARSPTEIVRLDILSSDVNGSHSTTIFVLNYSHTSLLLYTSIISREC